MKLPRRQFLRLTAGTATLPALRRIASALDYPTRLMRIIDGFPPGGASDIVARLTAQAIAAASPTIHRREPARRQLQHCG